MVADGEASDEEAAALPLLALVAMARAPWEIWVEEREEDGPAAADCEPAVEAL